MGPMSSYLAGVITGLPVGAIAVAIAVTVMLRLQRPAPASTGPIDPAEHPHPQLFDTADLHRMIDDYRAADVISLADRRDTRPT